MSHPWYEVVGSEVRLTQGDIILECPLLKWRLDDPAEGESKASGERLFKAAKGIKADVKEVLHAYGTAVLDIALPRDTTYLAGNEFILVHDVWDASFPRVAYPEGCTSAFVFFCCDFADFGATCERVPMAIA